jgi:hypothetical protein
MDSKPCSRCHQVLALDNFRVRHGKGRSQPHVSTICRYCENEYSKLRMRELARLKKENDIVEEEASEEEELPPPRKYVVSGHYSNMPEEKKQEMRERSRKYKQENKDKINATRRKSTRRKMKNPIERMKRTLKTLLAAKIKKSAPSTEYLGTSMETVKRWLEFNFEEGMSWDNYGKEWHIDHTIAIQCWDLTNEDDVKSCFNWKNLMPLSKERNLRKSYAVLPCRVFLQEQRLREFKKQFDVDEDFDMFLQSYIQKLETLMPSFYMRHAQIAETSLSSKLPLLLGNRQKDQC